MKRIILLIIAAVIGYAAHDPLKSISNPMYLLTCSAPSGAMSSIQYKEMFIGKLHDLQFSCIPMHHNPCESYACVKFTAVDEQDKHVIGYVWRNVFNHPEAATCSPDGGKAGTFYGECPVGVPVATVYSCPWCEPDFNATADKRGVNP